MPGEKKAREACKSLCAWIATVCLKFDFHLALKYGCIKMLWLTVTNTGKKLISEMAEEMNRCNHVRELKQQFQIRELQAPNSLVMSSV